MMKTRPPLIMLDRPPLLARAGSIPMPLAGQRGLQDDTTLNRKGGRAMIDGRLSPQRGGGRNRSTAAPPDFKWTGGSPVAAGTDDHPGPWWTFPWPIPSA